MTSPSQLFSDAFKILRKSPVKPAAILGISLLFLSGSGLYADSASWQLNPTTNDWNTAANWSPNTIPNGSTQVATFGVSNTTNVACGYSPDHIDASTVVGSIVFEEGASAYTITATPAYQIDLPSLISIEGAGIINNSGLVQHLVAGHSDGVLNPGRVYFSNLASAGENIVVTNEGGVSSTGNGFYGGFTQFWGASTASDSTFISNGGTVAGARGGTCSLLFSSNAESATFISNPGEVEGAGSAYTWINTSGHIGSSTFIGNPAMITGAGGGWVEWDIGTAAGATFIANGATTAGPQAGQIYVYGGDGYATFIGKGGQGAGSEGGLIDLFSSPSSDQTVVSAEAGIDGGQGGRIVIEGKAKVDLVQFQLFGNGLLDLSAVKPTALTIGSLSGDGIVLLSGHNLKMGNNNLTTVFAGSIQEAGSVFKLGTGTVTLTGANSYTGGTTLGAGSFLVANTTGSGTGTGPISVTAGILGGTGVISGPTNIGTGAGAGAFLVPAASSKTQATLTIQSGLTFNSDATYTCTLKARKNKGVSDKVVAKGVTINNGAMITLSSQVKGQLTTGLTLTLLSNTSGTPISGTFSNLPDGGIVTIKGNHFQATYSGGDGNDLTLTVVP